MGFACPRTPLPLSESQPPSPPSDAAASVSAQIARYVTTALRSVTGRGPTTARVHQAPGLVTVVLWDSLTVSERTLASRGYVQEALAMRDALIATRRADLIDAITGFTGAPVESFHFAQQMDPDIATLNFVLRTDPDAVTD